MSPLLARTAALLPVAVLHVALAAPALAQDAPASRLSVHGYLTQAYGQSERGTVMGLTPDGTSDYRRAAVLARYAATSKDAFVVQLAHRRLGDSPTMNFEDETKLDMAFYERRFGSGTRLRVGKSVIPYGIYNEVRYAGPLLPFYRAPFTLYGEGHYVSETIDGVVVTHTLRAGEPWELNVDAYGGSFSLVEFQTFPTGPSTFAYVGAEIKAKKVLGGQLWITTPITGVRLGGATRTEEHFGGVFPRPNGVSATTLAGSLDASFDRWQLRSEASRVKTYGVLVNAGYAQLGVRPRAWLGVNAQMEVQDIDFVSPPAPTLRLARDQALGVNLYVSPLMVLKLELHGTKGYAYEQVVDGSAPPIKGSYFITSFSVAF